MRRKVTVCIVKVMMVLVLVLAIGLLWYITQPASVDTIGNSQKNYVLKLVGAAQDYARGVPNAQEPFVVMMFNATSETALQTVTTLADERFTPNTTKHIILNGGEFDDARFIRQLKTHPDSIILIDWTKGERITNLGTIKRLTDSRCALLGCEGVTRAASLILIATNLSRDDFINRNPALKGGHDILARATTDIEHLD